MPTKRVLGTAAALAAGLTGGGLAGAWLATPGTAVGQEDDDTTTSAADDTTTGTDDTTSGSDDTGTDDTTSGSDDTGTPEGSDEPDTEGSEDGRCGPGRGYRYVDLDVAAEALGVTDDELREALVDGSSIADVAAERGVDVQVVIDALVADATAEIQEAVADGDLDADRAAELTAALPERITDLVNREGLRGGPRGVVRRLVDLDVAGEALGVTDDELREALVDGSSIADVAAERGVDVQVVIDALVADATAEIQEAVADGDLDADRAAELTAALPERITDLVNGEGFRVGPGPRGFLR